MKVKKAVIPAAGLGTRFLPATKAQPKEMLPIVDKPAVQYIVEEAAAAGIESILFVTGRNKKAIEDHFDRSMELEQMLAEKEKWNDLDEVRSISMVPSIHFIRQQEPLGLGHAILCAEKFVGNEPFAVLLGDDIMVAEKPGIKQLMEEYEKKGSSVIGVQQVQREDVSKYGIIKTQGPFDEIARVADLIEKPALEQAPSDLAIMGRYVLTPAIFQKLRGINKGAGNEYQLTDAIRAMLSDQDILAKKLEGSRYDIGSKLGYIKAVLEIGTQRKDLREEILAMMQQLTGNREVVR